jgi:hypothetical protein
LNSSLTGSNDIAAVIDPVGTGGDVAYAGSNRLDSSNFDLGAILFDDNALAGGATGADYLYDILSPFGENAGAAAAVGAGKLLTDLLLLF